MFTHKKTATRHLYSEVVFYFADRKCTISFASVIKLCFVRVNVVFLMFQSYSSHEHTIHTITRPQCFSVLVRITTAWASASGGKGAPVDVRTPFE